jgi:hypothetical protein
MAAAGWLAAGAAAVAAAAEGDARPAPPQVLQEVADGFASLRGGDVIGALRRWTTGGGLENRDTLTAVEEQLQGYRKNLGTLGDVHLLRTVPLGPNGRIDFLAVDYNRGPVYARFHLYLRRNRWSVIGLTFNPDPTKILPERLLDGG